MASMSLSDYLPAEIKEIAERPTLAEFRDRLHKSLTTKTKAPLLKLEEAGLSIQRRKFSANLGVINLLVLTRFIPQRQFDPVPQSQFVVDQSQVVFHNVFGGSERIGDLPVLAALGYALNNDLFAFAGPAAVCCLSNHSCLL
jgi:hypothetical protein